MGYDIEFFVVIIRREPRTEQVPLDAVISAWPHLSALSYQVQCRSLKWCLFLYKRKMGGCLHCLCVVDYFRGSASVFVWNSWLEICNGNYTVIRNTLLWL